MGCGASTAQNVASQQPDLNAGNGASQPLNEATALPGGARGAEPAGGFHQEKLPANGTVTTGKFEAVQVLGEEDPESPVTVRVADKRKKSATQADEDADVVTIWDENASPTTRTAQLRAEAQSKAIADADAAAIAAALAADEAEEEAQMQAERTSTLMSLRPGQPAQQQVDIPKLENDPLSRDPSQAAWGTGKGDTGWDPYAKVEINLNVLKEIDPCPGPGPANRYDQTLTLSEDDSDDEGGGASTTFNLAVWKRFYHWNKKKPDDLLKQFWKSFDPKKFSLHCVSYRLQDQFFAAYQCDNLLTGYLHRLFLGGVKCFGLFHALYNYDTQQYKIVGLLIFEGQALPKTVQVLPDFDDYCFMKADPSDSAVKTFVGALLTSNSPVPQLNLMATREALLC